VLACDAWIGLVRMQVPGFLAEAWENSHQTNGEDDEELQGAKLGQVQIDVGTDGKAKFRFELDDALNKQLPKAYDMGYTADELDMVLFSDAPDGSTAVEGRVQQKFDLRPAMDEQGNVDEVYRALARKRFQSTGKKTRTIKVLDELPGRVETARVLPTAGVEHRRKGLEKGAYLSDLRRTRMEKSDLENLLFRLFERQPSWSFNQLQNETNQPTAFLKEVLNEIALLNRKGPNQYLWELKPDYRHDVS